MKHKRMKGTTKLVMVVEIKSVKTEKHCQLLSRPKRENEMKNLYWTVNSEHYYQGLMCVCVCECVISRAHFFSLFTFFPISLWTLSNAGNARRCLWLRLSACIWIRFFALNSAKIRLSTCLSVTLTACLFSLSVCQFFALFCKTEKNMKHFFLLFWILKILVKNVLFKCVLLN